MNNSLTAKYNKSRFSKMLYDLKASHIKTISEPIQTKDKDEKKYIVFTLISEFFAIEISRLIEVLFKKKIVKVPFEDSISGIINHQNTILTVLNLYNIFNIKQHTNKNYYIIIFKHQKSPLAILCDEIENIIEIKDNKIIPNNSKKNLIAGNTYINKKLITIINTNFL